MNIDKYVEENPLRFRMIGEACKKLAIENTAITEAALASALPLDFCICDADPWRMIGAETIRSVADGTMAPTPDPPAPAPDPASRESLAAQLLDTQRKAAELRGELH